MRNTVAVVVTYNRKKMLVECIKKLQEQKRQCDIIIVDNNSTDNTYDEIRKFIDNHTVFYFNTGKNLGGAGGFNYGMKKALEKNWKYIWLMDDDTFTYSDTLEQLENAADSVNGKFGFLSSVALWKDKSVCNMNIQRTSLKNKITTFDDKITQVIMATFVSFFVKRDTVMELGFPISDFFIWSDDLEYSRRISLKYPCYVVGKSKVLHNMNSNDKVGIENESLDRLNRYEYLYRNEVYVYRREGVKGWLYLVLRILLHTIRVLVKKTNNKAQKIKVIWSSFFKGIVFHPKVEYWKGLNRND